MPSTMLAAEGDATPAVAIGNGITIQAQARGTFRGALLYERRPSASADWEPMASGIAGNPLQFTGTHAALMVAPAAGEPAAEIRARLTHLLEGQITVRIGL